MVLLFLFFFGRKVCYFHYWPTLQKHAHSNILNILQPKKKENFQIKISDIFHISSENINCRYLFEPF